MKAIMISIHPEWVAKIANGIKTIEIRKTAPKCDLPIDVYIYCTKGDKNAWLSRDDHSCRIMPAGSAPFTLVPLLEAYTKINSKVVGKFTLRKVDRFLLGSLSEEVDENWVDVEYDYYDYMCALEKACLTSEEAKKYAPDGSFYAWHISDLEIFDEPKPLSEFGLKRPPQSWQYVEAIE